MYEVQYSQHPLLVINIDVFSCIVETSSGKQAVEQDLQSSNTGKIQ